MTDAQTPPPPSSVASTATSSPSSPSPRPVLRTRRVEPTDNGNGGGDISSSNNSANGGNGSSSAGKTAEKPIDVRLNDAFEGLSKTYKTWASTPRQKELKEKLLESMHETRRVLAAVEIGIAMSERETQSQDAIPVPRHRSNPLRKPDTGNSNSEE